MPDISSNVTGLRLKDRYGQFKWYANLLGDEDSLRRFGNNARPRWQPKIYMYIKCDVK